MKNITENIQKKFTEILRMDCFSEETKLAYKQTDDAKMFYETIKESEISGAYYWEDIDYSNKDRGPWKCAEHYGRINTILIENSPERLKNDSEYREKMVGALKYWLHHDFSNPNWWHGDIGTPKAISEMLLLFNGVLDEMTFEKAVSIIARGSMATRSDISEEWTGANLVNGGINTIYHALFINDGELLKKAVNRISEEIRIDTEGIQPDGSFFQHGRRLYSGAYGATFAHDISRLCFVLQSTDCQFEKEKLELFLTHVLDGVRYMTRGCCLDMAAVNRAFVREDGMNAGNLKTVLELMLRTEDMPRKDEIKEYLDALNGGKQLNRTKLFPHAMMLCHHTDDFYVGAKFTNNTLWDQDTCNSEGELALNMTYGTHISVMKDGSEYLSVIPMWDFSRVPGTTSRTESDEELQAHFDEHNWCCDPLPNDHAGCMQKGNKALIYELAQHDGVEALVTDFAFDDGFVSLGAGIIITDGREEDLVTTIDQSRLQGEIIKEDNSYLHHGIRYTLLENTDAKCDVIKAEGDWQRVSRSEKSKKIKGDIFLLTISHAKCDKYAYMISSANKKGPDVKVIRNDENVQAILTPDNRIMAVFHKDDALRLGEKVINGTKSQIIVE